MIYFAVDFEQPRALWQKVFDDTAKAHFIGNVAGHIKNVKSKVVLERQCTCYCGFPKKKSHVPNNSSLSVCIRCR